MRIKNLEQFVAERRKEYDETNKTSITFEDEAIVWAIDAYLSHMGELKDEDKTWLKQYDAELYAYAVEQEGGYEP